MSLQSSSARKSGAGLQANRPLELAASGAPRHFLDLKDISPADLKHILREALLRKKLRAGWPKGTVDTDRLLEGYMLALWFEKESTRTRVSFDVGMRQLGGQTLLLSGKDMHLGRGETVSDTAQVLSRYVDAVMIRCGDHSDILEVARHATIPVINGLTGHSHPCQLMADMLTLQEHFGGVEGLSVAWIGDGNNMATSWVHAAALFNFELRLACPKELAPAPDLFAWAERLGAKVSLVEDPKEAVRGTDCVVTDTWLSLNDDEETRTRRHALLAPYQVNMPLMGLAKSEAVFMHCLPAHRGEEVTPDVIDGPQSVVWDEAENRLHAQKAVLGWCLDRL